MDEKLVQQLVNESSERVKLLDARRMYYVVRIFNSCFRT